MPHLHSLLLSHDLVFGCPIHHHQNARLLLCLFLHLRLLFKRLLALLPLAVLQAHACACVCVCKFVCVCMHACLYQTLISSSVPLQASYMQAASAMSEYLPCYPLLHPLPVQEVHGPPFQPPTEPVRHARIHSLRVQPPCWGGV